MKNTTKFILGALMLGAFAVSAFAAAPARREVPTDQRGVPMAPFAYADSWYVSNTTEKVVCSGRCLLLGLIRSSGNPATSIKVRDTSVADGSGNNLLPWIHFSRDTAAHDNVVPFAVKASSGISVQIPAQAEGEAVTVLFVDTD